jgi:hypothetical protein
MQNSPLGYSKADSHERQVRVNKRPLPVARDRQSLIGQERKFSPTNCLLKADIHDRLVSGHGDKHRLGQ